MHNRQYTHSHRAEALCSPEQLAELAVAVRSQAPEGDDWTGRLVAVWMICKLGRLGLPRAPGGHAEQRYPALQGFYLFGDPCGGRVYGLVGDDATTDKPAGNQEPAQHRAYLSSFGQNDAARCIWSTCKRASSVAWRPVALSSYAISCRCDLYISICPRFCCYRCMCHHSRLSSGNTDGNYVLWATQQLLTFFHHSVYSL